MADQRATGSAPADHEEPQAEGELNIASRTRSHLRIDNFVATDNLDFPDVEPNLYQDPDSEVDTEYKKFLNQCYSEEFGGDTNTDDNDPEYVYNDDIFSHGWRFDLDEVIELIQDESNTTNAPALTELHPAGEHDESPAPPVGERLVELKQEPYIKQEQEHQHQVNLSSEQPPPFVPGLSRSPLKAARRKLDLFDDPEFARVLNQQLRQHIQLLSQTFLLAKHSTNMRREADEAKGYLDAYMKVFKHKNKPANLLPALELVENLEPPKELKSSIRLSWRPIPLPEPVRRIIRHNPHIFMYCSLLPKVAFSFLPDKLIPKKPKINFTENEDKLLAYALNEFKGETSQYAFIASLLMPAKNKTQISNHIKNIKRSAGCEWNPIKLYYSTGQLPEIDLSSETKLVDPSVIVQEEEIIDIDEVKGECDEINNVAEADKSQPEASPATDEMKLPVIIQQDSDVIRCVEATLNQQPSTSQELLTPIVANGSSPLATEEVNESEVEELREEPKDMTPVELGSPPSKTDETDNTGHQEDIMNMNLDDLIAASTTISKSTMLNNNSESNHNKNLKSMKLKKSMLNLMSHNFLLSDSMGDLITHDFLKTAKQKLSEADNMQLLRLLAKLAPVESGCADNQEDQRIVSIYHEISGFLTSVNAPPELLERTVLFLNLNQATKSGCSVSYLHWMKFFEFMQHVELYHDKSDVLEKKLVRLLDALQKEDMHKVRLAVANLIDKHPFLKRQFDLLFLDEKPHPSLFIWDDDFDDITEPINLFGRQQEPQEEEESLYEQEHFYSKVSEEELRYASQSCPCRCHSSSAKFSQHCDKCNLKFVKGRMYLVSKIKPILAEWFYTGRQWSSPPKPAPAPISGGPLASSPIVGWTLEEDREILEFCRMKAEQSGEAISFDTSIFEELVSKRRTETADQAGLKRSTREIAERFDQLMDLYREEHPTSSSNQSQSQSSSTAAELSRRSGAGSFEGAQPATREEPLMRDAHHQ